MTDFDPYQQWLGIPAAFRPLNHYLLLGISLYESRPDVILNAWDTKMELVRQHQSGPRGEICGNLLTELTQAKQVLLNDGQRRAYDDALMKSFQRAIDIDKNAVNLTQQNPSVPFGSRSDLGVSIRSNSEVPHGAGQNDVESPDDRDLKADLWSLINPGILLTLTAVILMAMLATIFLFSKRDNDNQRSTNISNRIATAPRDAEITTSPVEPRPDESAAQPEAAQWTGPVCSQNSDAEFTLRPVDCLVDGQQLSRTATGLAGWSSTSDSATWMIDVTDRKTSFFYCEITYQSNKECRLSTEIGKQVPRPFSLYPRSQPFTERFIVRLGEGKQLVKIAVVKIEPATSLNLQQIKLIPN